MTQVRAPGDVLVHLRRARDHADRHYTEPLDLESLAAVAGLSKFQRRYAATGAPHIPGCFVFMWGLAERASQEKPPDQDAP
jgi:hypothetical protein